MRKKFYQNGIRFKCQNTGKCCKVNGYVYLTLKECRQIAKYLGFSTQEFMEQYAKKTRSKIHFKEINLQCPFLKRKGCTIYTVRPLQCRTWPFWQENMKKSIWETEIKKDCSGIGKGRLYTMREIEDMLKKHKC